MHKLIQVVDENGNFLKLSPGPGEAMRNAEIRLISRVILSDNKGRYLLQKRAATMKRWPDRWDSSAAGHVDEGENPTEAAYRELFEEIGIKHIKLVQVKEFYFANAPEKSGAADKTCSHIYVGTYEEDLTTLKLDSEEVAEVRLFTKNEIQKLIESHPEQITDGVRIIFQEVIK